MPATRKKLIARLHITAKDAGLIDPSDKEHGKDAYIEFLKKNANGKTSAADCSDAQLKRLVAMLSNKQKGYPNRPNNADRNHLIKKIEAYLSDANLPWAYAVGMARHMYKKDAIEFCSGWELNGIISALEKRARKALIAELDELLPTINQGWAFAYTLAVKANWISRNADLQKNSQAMSLVKRVITGELALADANARAYFEQVVGEK